MKLRGTYTPLAVNIPAMVQKIQHYIYRTFELFMAFFSFTGYSYYAQQANMSIPHFVLKATLTMFPVILIFSIMICPFTVCRLSPEHFFGHSFLALVQHVFSAVISIPELIVIDGFILAAINDRYLRVWGIIGLLVVLSLRVACYTLKRVCRNR